MLHLKKCMYFWGCAWLKMWMWIDVGENITIVTHTFLFFPHFFWIYASKIRILYRNDLHNGKSEHFCLTVRMYFLLCTRKKRFLMNFFLSCHISIYQIFFFSWNVTWRKSFRGTSGLYKFFVDSISLSFLLLKRFSIYSFTIENVNQNTTQ